VSRLALLGLLLAAGFDPAAAPLVSVTPLSPGLMDVTSSAVPAAIAIRTSRGEGTVPVALHRGHAALPAEGLARLLPVAEEVIDDWAVVAFAGEPYRFLLGAPVMVSRGRVVPLAGGAYVVRDSLFVPLQWLAEYVPAMFGEGYRYDPRTARFEEARLSPIASVPVPVPQPASPVVATRPASSRARASGLRMAHTVVVDPGHGGVDPGNPGRYLPRGVQEKHVTLSLGMMLREELERHGVDVIMTRTSDTLIGLRDRAPMCHDDCDLFVSIHVNSLERRSGYERVNGVETYFLGEPQTAEAERVARMENEALRYETDDSELLDDALSFIIKDLHTNEFLRESASLADMVQTHAAAVHPGRNRGVAQGRWVVLMTATRPAILVETGFATNRRDGEFLASSQGQRQLARAMANGIVEYLKRYENKVLPN
jgi:N-acetylmuramoyl-L-alanine amidase